LSSSAAKLLSWGPRLLACAVAGFLLRYARRLARRPPRVWHGVFPMHMIRDMVDVDRRAGLSSHSIVVHAALNQSYSLVDTSDFDVDLAREGVAADALHWALLCRLLLRADVFVHFFDTRFAAATRPQATARALRWLQRVGIRLVAVPSGLDVVYWTGRTTRFGFLDKLQADYPGWDLRADAEHMREAVESICGLADFVVSGDAVCSRFMTREDLRFKYFPIDTERLRPSPSESRPSPRIVHAPNHRHIKGTDALLAATDRLRRTGFDFELELVEKVARARAQEIYASADVLAYQFCHGSFGLFALEALPSWQGSHRLSRRGASGRS